MKSFKVHPVVLLQVMLFLCIWPVTTRGQSGQHGPLTYSEQETFVEITQCDISASGEIVVPEIINGKPVTAIGAQAFYECVNVTDIVLPDSVTSIGPAAFAGCPSLVHITLSSNLTSIPNAAFALCANLPGITLPENLTSIGSSAFNGCTTLSSIVIPDTVTSIGDGAFYECQNLNDITFPSELTTIGSNAFTYCRSLTSLALPAGVNSIGDTAFANCTSLRSISLPSALTVLNSFTFLGCTELTRITIPSAVTSIGDRTFDGCTSLTSATFQGDAPTLGSSAFARTAPEFTIYFFEGSSGFTSPTWNGYPSENLGSYSPVTSWLMGYNLDPDTNLASDLNDDGVSVLMAYALNLDPTTNLARRLPRATVAGGILQMAFYAGAEAVSYTVETSTNLSFWNDVGVTLSEPNAGGVRTASVPLDVPSRFLRLRIVH